MLMSARDVHNGYHALWNPKVSMFEARVAFLVGDPQVAGALSKVVTMGARTMGSHAPCNPSTTSWGQQHVPDGTVSQGCPEHLWVHVTYTKGSHALWES